MLPTNLKTIPLFSELSVDEIAALAQMTTTRTFAKNTVVINEGDHTDALYIINSGRSAVTKIHEDGKEMVVAVLGPGDYFGEMALIDEQPRSANVITKEPSQFSIVMKQDFQRLLMTNPELSLKIMKGLSQRLRSAMRQIEGLAFMDVYGRIARLLLEIASPPDPDSGDRTIAEPLTHKDIASRVGASREVISRIMKDLATGGYISTHNKRITIHSRLPPAW